MIHILRCPGKAGRVFPRRWNRSGFHLLAVAVHHESRAETEGDEERHDRSRQRSAEGFAAALVMYRNRKQVKA